MTGPWVPHPTGVDWRAVFDEPVEAPAANGIRPTAPAHAKSRESAGGQRMNLARQRSRLVQVRKNCDESPGQRTFRTWPLKEPGSPPGSRYGRRSMSNLDRARTLSRGPSCSGANFFLIEGDFSSRAPRRHLDLAAIDPC